MGIKRKSFKRTRPPQNSLFMCIKRKRQRAGILARISCHKNKLANFWESFEIFYEIKKGNINEK